MTTIELEKKKFSLVLERAKQLEETNKDLAMLISYLLTENKKALEYINSNTWGNKTTQKLP
jgi:hypothetical protein